jgi:hypothetical protein
MESPMLQIDQAFERLTTPKPWSDDEIVKLKDLRLTQGLDWDEIAVRLDRTTSGVKSKFKYVQFDALKAVRHVPIVSAQDPVPPTVLQERAQRLSVMHQRDLTASICGDPAPGRSALDEWRAKQAKI